MLTSSVEPTFKLSENFLSNYKGKQPKWGFGNLSYFTYKRTYARLMDDGTQEEFVDTLERVANGTYRAQEKHCKAHGLYWNGQKAQRSAQEMFERMWTFKFLPPGRGLWMMGTKHVDSVGSAATNNCFSGDTEIYIYKDGITKAKLSDLLGEDVLLFSHTLENGKTFQPVRAKIHTFGKQKIQKVIFKPFGLRTNFHLDYDVTPDHRWILSDGTSTTSLKVGDKVQILSDRTALDKESYNYKEGFAHGLIFGDGSRHTYYPHRHLIRLCGEKEQHHKDLLKEIKGYHATTYPKTYNGDAVVTIVRPGENWKALPENKDKVYLKGFIEGWIAADAHFNWNGSLTLDTQSVEAAEWITNFAPLTGYLITGFNIDSKPTNYGPRKNPLNRISLVTLDSVEYKVSNIIDEGREEEVFCPVVPDVNSFALVGGLVTGNCGYISTSDIGIELGIPFAWAMDMLMVGVGVGFDTKGAGLVKVRKPTGSELISVIGDSREDWVLSVRDLINSYHKNNTPITFSYDEIRGPGLPIKGFGGVSSGPQPLQECHESVRKLLNELDGQAITSVCITDIMNFIGKCVVAGNVRRSAEICIGDIEDEEYISMKDPVLYEAELLDRRWASNNSVFVNTSSNFAKVKDKILTNGEPGLIFLDHARHYGRMKDGYVPETDRRYDHVAGFNPCFTGDTLVGVADGRGAVSLLDLANEGKDVPVYSINKQGTIEIKMGRNPRLTGANQELVKITLDDGTSLRVTPNHKMLLLDGTQCEAKDLKKGDSLPAFSKCLTPVNKKDRKSRYLMINCDTVWVDNKLHAKKKCEACATEFLTTWGKREIAYCSKSCGNKSKNGIKSRKQGQKQFFNDRQRSTLHDQVMQYKDLQDNLKRDPLKKEWENACRLTGTSFRLRPTTDLTENPYTLTSFNHLKEISADYNHRVVSVEFLTEKEDVYNITVDDNHTVAIVTDFSEKGECSGILTANCGEQGLESYELCCLVETFPSNHETPEDFYKTLKFAYLYAKSVTLIPTHDMRTNAVIMRNRRIGASMSGIQQAINKFGRQNFFSQWCDKGYDVIKKWDIIYSRWFGVPESKKTTTVKPSGTVSLLAGVAPGIHFTHSAAYYRTVRLSASSPYVPKLIEANYRIEYNVTDWKQLQKSLNKVFPEGSWSKDEVKTVVPEQGEVLKEYGDLGGSLVVYFPVIEKDFKKSKFEVTLWEQLATVREMQYWWSDNSVSCTVTVTDAEREDLLPAIETFAPYVKTLSFLPLQNHSYQQAPYQEANQVEIQDYITTLKELNLKEERQTEIAGSKFCDGDVCEIP